MNDCCSVGINRKGEEMFQTEKTQQDRAYLEMLKPVIRRMSGINIQDMAVKAGGRLADTGDRIILHTLGKQVSVRIPECEIDPPLESWHALVLLHYLINADGMPPVGEWISFEDMRDGLVRGTKFAGSSARWFRSFLKGKKINGIEAACLALGGEITSGRGDSNIRVPFFPNFPMLISLWEADEDFDATGKILIERNADHYLSIEDAVTVGEILHKEIEKKHRIINETVPA